MNAEHAREVFNKVAEHHRASGNHDAAARTEMVREYFTNPEFRKGMENFVWEMNNNANGWTAYDYNSSR